MLPAGQPVSFHSLAPGVLLYVLPAQRFVTLHVVIAFRRLLSAETVTMEALLPRVLSRGTRRFPDRAALAGRLEELYGAAIRADASKAGDHRLLELDLSCPGSSVVAGLEDDGPPPFGEALGLLAEMLADPASPALRPDYVDEEKGSLARDIAALKDDRLAYAHHRCLEEMCRSQPFALHGLGRAEDVEKITPSKLDAFRRESLARDQVSAYLAGPVDDAVIAETRDVLKGILAGSGGAGAADGPIPQGAAAPPGGPVPQGGAASPGGARRVPPASQPHKSQGGEREVFEEAPVEQGRLVIGLSTGVVLTSPDYPAGVIYNGLLGGFVHSRLFRRIREEAGLAYYAYSRFIPAKGIILISCGIQERNFHRALDLIRGELASLRRGDIGPDEFEATRNSVLAASKSRLDSPGSLIYGHMERASAGEVLEEIAPWLRLAEVGLGDVKEFAQRPELDTVYLLGRAGPRGGPP